jgi:ankyrin repeat protein
MWTPLHHAAHGGHAKLAAILLSKGADYTARTPLGLTACHLAALRGDEATVNVFMGCAQYRLLKTQNGRTILHSAAQGGHLGVIRMLLKDGCDVSAKDEYGQTARDLVQGVNSIGFDVVFSAYSVASFEQADDLVEVATDDKADPEFNEENHDQDTVPTDTDGWFESSKLSVSVPRLRIIPPTPPPSPTASP